MHLLDITKYFCKVLNYVEHVPRYLLMSVGSTLILNSTLNLTHSTLITFPRRPEIKDIRKNSNSKDLYHNMPISFATLLKQKK